jgi:methylglutaconyl-CoA hydratase
MPSPSWVSDAGFGEHVGTWVDLQRLEHHWQVGIGRPPVNALDEDVVEQLLAVCASANSDPSCRALLLRSQVEGTFCGGADIGLLRDGGEERRLRFSHRVRRCFSTIEDLAMPVIAAVEGHAVGGGLEMLLTCDVVVAADRPEISFGLPEVKLGVLAGAGGTQRLTRRVGKAAATVMMMTGELISPRRAYELGIVSVLTAPGETLAYATALTESLSSGPTAALAAIKRCIAAATSLDSQGGLTFEANEAEVLMETSDAREGLQAFLEHREPVFKGE